MSDHSDGPSVRITTLSRVFVGDTVSRVFISEPVSRVFVGDTTLEGTSRRAAVLANETISDSDMVGGDRHGAGTAKRGGVYQRSSRREFDVAEYQSEVAPGLD